MKRASVLIFAVVAAICIALTDSATAAELRLRTDARPQGGVVRLGDVADILSGGETRNSNLGANRTHSRAGAGEATNHFGTRNSRHAGTPRHQHAAHPFTGASQVTVVGYVEPAAKAAAAKAKTLALLDRARSATSVTAAIVRGLQEANGSDDPWTADVELTDAQAQAVLADVHHVRGRGGAGAVGRDVRSSKSQCAPIRGRRLFTLEAQSRHAVGRRRDDRCRFRGAQFSSATDVTLQRSEARILQIDDAFQSLDDVVGPRSRDGDRAGANPRSAIHSHAGAREARQRGYRRMCKRRV